MNVLDSSALLALLLQEPGAEEVEAWIAESLLLTVNLTEVVDKMVARGWDRDELLTDLHDSLLGIVPLDYDLALDAAELYGQTRDRGLSLADRACLALAKAMQCAAVTADRAWSGLELGIPIHLVR